MAREIKFRAWDKEEKQFTAMSLEGIFAFYDEGNGDRLELMQYTGLKDKNGKEIYEGDIISRIGCGLSKVVEWRETKKYAGFNIGNEYKYGIEVIGNIYSNPELLKDEKAS